MRKITPAMKKAFTNECLRLSLESMMPKVKDAYSADRYTSWTEVARLLLKNGFNSRQTEAVMCSKWTRWAADQSGQAYGRVSAKHVLRFCAKQGRDEVVKLTEEHFSGR